MELEHKSRRTYSKQTGRVNRRITVNKLDRRRLLLPWRNFLSPLWDKVPEKSMLLPGRR